MPSIPAALSWSGLPAPDLFAQASSILAREVSRVSAKFPGTPAAGYSDTAPAVPGVDAAVHGLEGRTCPVTGAVVKGGGDKSTERLRQQAYELVTTLFTKFGEAGGNYAVPAYVPEPSRVSTSAPGVVGADIKELADRLSPVSGAVPLFGFDRDRLRRQAHEFIESLLVTFSQATGEQAAPYEDQVPLIRCASPVQAGGDAGATMRIANEEGTPSVVSLYCTNFVADSGYEIPSLRVTVSPRSTTIPASGEATFEIKVAVSQQTPAGIYSGLIQAMGSKYVKAVLSVEVL